MFKHLMFQKTLEQKDDRDQLQLTKSGLAHTKISHAQTAISQIGIRNYVVVKSLELWMLFPIEAAKHLEQTFWQRGNKL